jgi:hypothetical protein
VTSVDACPDGLRTEAVRDASTVNGIDYLEVLPGQRKLEVHFLHPLPGETDEVPADGTGTKLNKAHVVIEGGDRVRGIRAQATSTSGQVFTVTTSGPGDFSTYRLRLVDPATGSTPLGFDPRLSELDFSFKAGCPTRFDCGLPAGCPPTLLPSTVRDYQAKDYDSFRQLMLNRIAAQVPGWDDTNAADQEVALVELLAYAADRLSYEQDAVATEAYLGTARRRVSVRRHARLLGYRMHEGCAARTFVHVPVAATQTIDAGARFRTGTADDHAVQVFESLHSLAARPEHSMIRLHTWSDDLCCLARGATSAVLRADPALSLAVGDFLLFEEIAGAVSGDAADADRSHRAVVRLTEVGPVLADPLDLTPIMEVRWGAEDALPFAFRVSAQTVADDGTRGRSVLGVARGNMVLVEHGARVAPVRLSTELDALGRWRPGLPDGRPTYAVPYDDLVTGSDGIRRRPSARALLAVDPRAALPAVEVWPENDPQDDKRFHPRLDLLGSDPDDRDLVVEADDDGSAVLRFGDGTYGRVPDVQEQHLAGYRTGHGAAGNVGAEAITRFDADASIPVRNPLPATGGVDAELTEQVRADAPYAFRVQERAVTEADYGTILTERFPGVQRAAGRLRWTGSWYTAFVTVDRLDGLAVDREFRDEVGRFLDGYRMAGVDVDVARPLPVPVELELAVCAQPGRFNTDVERDVLDVLSAGVTRDGRPGLFHPDHFTFGTPVYLSRVYAAVLGVPGVATVRATRFQRYGEFSRGELAAGVLRVHDLEIAQLANDPDVPERGVLSVHVAGGR